MRVVWCNHPDHPIAYPDPHLGHVRWCGVVPEDDEKAAMYACLMHSGKHGQDHLKYIVFGDAYKEGFNG
jgi:hypothetical protein